MKPADFRFQWFISLQSVLTSCASTSTWSFSFSPCLRSICETKNLKVSFLKCIFLLSISLLSPTPSSSLLQFLLKRVLKFHILIAMRLATRVLLRTTFSFQQAFSKCIWKFFFNLFKNIKTWFYSLREFCMIEKDNFVLFLWTKMHSRRKDFWELLWDENLFPEETASYLNWYFLPVARY